MRLPHSINSFHLLVLGLGTAVLTPGQVTTYHYNSSRTGATLTETALSTSNVSVNTFGKLFSLSVDGQTYAQPLYVPNVSIPQQGVHNVVYVATENNSVYAFDADSASQKTPLWHVNLGPAMPSTSCCMLQDLQPQIGITSTPVIDLTSDTLYVVAESLENRVAFFRLHALDITTGADRVTPAVIQGSVPGTSFDSVNGVLSFNPIQHWQRPGLLLMNGNIYIGFGSHQDNTPYHGWLFAYSASTLQQTAIFCFAPGGEQNAIWQGGAGLAADASGNIYLETGNGPFDVTTGGQDYGDSLVKVGTANGLSVVDYFAPSTQLTDQNNDWDLGSSGPVLIPGTALGVAGGKEGKIYVFNTGNLGKYNPLGDQVVQEWQATFAESQFLPGGFWGGSLIFYNSTLYAFGERDVLKAFAFNGSQFNTTPTSQSTVQVPSGASDDPAMAISANGTVPGTAIVWAAFSSTGGANGNAFPGVLYAFDASDVSKQLWSSNQNSSRDYSGNWAKWVPPTIVNGKVYLPSYDNLVNVYGLLPGGQTIAPVLGTTPQSTAINTAYSTALQAVVKDGSNNPLSGVTVTFTAPSTGASGTFSGSGASATGVSNTSGIATAPTFTANGQAGMYNVMASAAGFTSPANFSLTNLSGTPASVTAMAGTPQSATVNTVFGTALQAVVKDAGNNPLNGVTVTFSAPGSGASATFAGSVTSATAVTNTAGIATAPALTANGQTGSYTVTASVAGLTTPANFSLTNTAGGGGGGGTASLVGSGNNATTTFNLTVEGSSDWVHWGDTVLNRKSGVTPQISAYSVVGSGQPLSYSNDPRPLSWTDGTPTASGSNNDGLYINFSQNGFSFTAPADSNMRTLTVHVGGWMTGGTLTAHLSDNSAPDYVDTTAQVSGQYDRNYTLTYTAASAGQTLKVSWVAISGGNVTLSGAAVSLAGPSIGASAGTPQSSTVNSAFGTALQAAVKDASGNPLSGVTVTFSTPGAGASATFSGGVASATAVTNTSGIATAPTLTANGQAGSYTVTASATGVSTPANFSLTNLLGSPATVTATTGTPQSATVNTLFGTTLQAVVKDAGNNPLSGVTVTFSAPSSGASALFSGSSPSATAVTNASGMASAPALTANAQAGSYTITASVAGVSTPASFSLTNTTGTGGGGTGSLSGSGNSATTASNLTAEGGADWVHWGDTALNRKSGVTAQVSNYTIVGSGPALSYTNDLRTLSWTDGTPTVSTSNNDGLYINSAHNGFSFTVPADGNTRILTVHAGGWMTGGTLTAHLSDGSAPDYVDSTITVSGQYDRNYTLTYSAASAGQTLAISWVAASGGNVTLSAAALALAGPGITTFAGTPQSATVSTAFGTALQAVVRDSSNNPLSGVTVTFTAPATGASATFSGSPSGTAVTNTSGIATAPTLTANSQAGSYTVTASATGVTTPANFSLTNLLGSPASVTATAGTPQSATVNAAFGTALQAVVKDAGNNPLSGVTVTFSAPSSGASATFSGGMASTTAVTNASGIATAPVLTANSQGGSYTVMASATGVATPANFSLTNLTGSPASITATAGTPQSATVNTAFGTALQAIVKDAGNNPLSGVTVTFSASTSGPSATFSGGVANATAVTSTSGIAIAPALTANGLAGSYTVTASVAGVSAPASFSLKNTAVSGGGAGSLSGSGNSAITAFNLTAEGSTDWVHWGDSALNRKSGVTAQISNYTVVGSGQPLSYTNDLRALSWTDGTPTGSASNNNGLYINFAQNGFSFTVPADGSTRNLTVHVGGWLTGATFRAHLSDGSASDYVDSTTPVSGQFDRNYTLTYNAASAGQTLTISWVATAGGNVTLNGAAFSVVTGPSIVASAGTPQSVAINTAFGTALQALVKDAGSNPLSGVTVTFSAPGTGASGTFSGLASATALTNASGIATAPTLTANGQAGAYTVSATAPGVPLAASFTLTNLAGSPAMITATAGTPQSTPVSRGFPTALQATVKDAGSNPVSGVTVTFTAPSSGATATFNGSATATAVTNASGVATAPALTANTQAGSYTVTATATGVSNPASFSLTNLLGSPASIAATAGTPQSTTVNSAFGSTLQATVKDGSNNPLSGVTVTFAAPASGASAAFGGSPTATSVSNASGVAASPALTATGLAGSYVVTATVSGVNTPASFNLTNLAGPAASISGTAGTPQTTTVNTPFGTNLQATVKDAANNPVSGVTVTFTNPASSASAAFSGSVNATATTNSSGIATAPVLTANGQTGTYSVTASVAGVSTPASFTLTNSSVSVSPITLVQHTNINSMINVSSESVAFKSANKAGNWIGVIIFAGQSSTHTFTVTDSNGNKYLPALTMGNTAESVTLGMYYAENIKGGTNQVTIVPDKAGYLRIVILEYSGLATSNSLDVTAAAQGNSTSPNSGTATTTASGDLLLGGATTADANTITAGPGYTLEEQVPLPPGTRLTVEDQVQASAGPASASLTLGDVKYWAMGMAAFKKAH